MTRRALPLVIAAATAAALAARPAAAAPPVRLVYARGPGAETCPDEGRLREAIAARVGYDPFFPVADLTVSVEVKRDAGELDGRIVLLAAGREKGSQIIRAARGITGHGECESLLDSIALAVSVALEGLAPRAAEEPTPHEPPPSAKEAEALPAAPPPPPSSAMAAIPAAAPSEAPSRRERLSLAVAPGLRASYGAWPVVAFAPDLAVEATLAWLGLGVEGRFDLPASVVVGGPDEQASVERLSGSIVPCAHFRSLRGCAIATLGETWARGGADIANASTATALYAAFGGRAGVEVTLSSRLRLLGTIDLVGVATPTTVQVGQGSTATSTRSGPVDGSLGIALLASIF
jgi:hypothetical protein